MSLFEMGNPIIIKYEKIRGIAYAIKEFRRFVFSDFLLLTVTLV